MTMTLIETKALVSAAASIVFTSIPQDGTDLVLFMSLRGTHSGVSQINIQFNSSGGTAYSDRFLQGSGSAPGSGSRASQPVIRVTSLPGTNFTSNTFGNTKAYIFNYSGATAKGVSLQGVTENNATESYMELVAGLWNDTSAITSITLTNQSGSNFDTNSVASLYKITKGSDGVTTVS
jgi:hypothetical protein